MSNRQLVVYENDPLDPDAGRLIAVPPNQATGVPLPTVNGFGPSRPTVGAVTGWVFMNTVTGVVSAWDGTVWRDFAQPILNHFPSDQDLLASLPIPGIMAIADDTGNVYSAGANGWTWLTLRNYPTVAALLADTTVPAGRIAYADDEETTWQMTASGWVCLSPRPLPTVVDALAWNPNNDGAEVLALDADARFTWHGGQWTPATALQANTQAALLGNAGAVWPNLPDGQIVTALDTGVTFTKIAGAWTPTGIVPGPEADILGNAGDWAAMPDGTTAAATDTGRIWTKAAGVWLGTPIRYYATEAALLADTPGDGTLAMAEDTGLVYGRMAGAWRRVNSPVSSVGTALPSTGGAGDLFYNLTDLHLRVNDGTNWVVLPRTYTGPAAPNAPVGGDTWWDGTHFLVFSGSGWMACNRNYYGAGPTPTSKGRTGDIAWAGTAGELTMCDAPNSNAWNHIIGPRTKSNNGFIVIAGVQICWSRHAVSVDSQTTLNFPRAFGGTPYVVLTSNAAGQYYGGATVRNASSFYYDRSDSASGTVTVYALAIGPAP